MVGAINFDYALYKNSMWSDILPEHQEYYEILGWNPEMWDDNMSDADKDDFDLHELDDLTWDELPIKAQQHYKDNGWTREKWNREGNTYEMDWDDVEIEVRKALIDLGWSKETWDSVHIMNSPAQEKPWGNLTEIELSAADTLGFNISTWFVKSSTENDFNPAVTHLPIPELELLNLDYFSSLNIPIKLCDGNTLGDDESCQVDHTMKDFVSALRKGSLLYLKYEDGDPLKKHIQSLIGDKVLKYLRMAVRNSHLRELGHYPPVYDNIKFDEYNWVFWLGGKNTTTSMHYDEDTLNFLWVLEGRKRIVIIPNDERTHGSYSCAGSKFDGHSCWTGVDILHGPLPPHAIELVLGAGDGILIPHKAWHAVQNLEATVAFGLRNDLPQDF